MTCKELILGNLLYYVIGQIIILIIAKQILYVTIGFALGVAIATFMIIHMSNALEDAMTLNEAGAERHVRKKAAVRLVAVLAAMIIIAVTNVGNILAMLIGTMALKVSAYLQPITHRVLVRKSTGKGG